MKSKRKEKFLRSVLIMLFLCLSLTGCRNYDDVVLDFYNDTLEGKCNVIQLDLGESNSGIYFITEHYGIWSNSEGTHLFCFDYVPRTQGGGELMINIITEQSYYQSVVQQDNGWASFYYGKLVFSGSCDFSDDEMVATVSPGRMYINEMSISPTHTVIMTKTTVSVDNIIPFDKALEDMNFVSDNYFEFLSNPSTSKYSCEMGDFLIDGSTMTGEWSTNGVIVPIRLQIHNKVPYIEMFDISGPSEKLILKSYAKVLNETAVELVDFDGVVFYAVPSTPIILTKTN